MLSMHLVIMTVIVNYFHQRNAGVFNIDDNDDDDDDSSVTRPAKVWR